jgi:cation transport protein ChaC
VAGRDADATLAYLRERELISSAYLEERHSVTLSHGASVEAVAYVVDTGHVQYCGGLPLETQAEIIARAVGGRGPNTEYLYNTVAHLAELGIADPDLEWLVARVRQLAEAGSAA